MPTRTSVLPPKRKERSASIHGGPAGSGPRPDSNITRSVPAGDLAGTGWSGAGDAGDSSGIAFPAGRSEGRGLPVAIVSAADARSAGTAGG